MGIGELLQWLPGSARLAVSPNIHDLELACQALAELHRVWSGERTQSRTCPALERRLQLLAEWQRLPKIGDDLHGHITALLQPRFARLHKQLHQLPEPWTLQPCLTDIHAAHVLLESQHVSGIVDYAEMQMDTPATDLARLLADCAPIGSPLFWAGYEAYRGTRGSRTPTEPLVLLLAEANVFCSLAHWQLRWNEVKNERIVNRIRGLMNRMQSAVQS